MPSTTAPVTTSGSRSRTSSRTRWSLPKAKSKYRGLLTEGRTGPGGPRVAILKPMTYMNDAGDSVGPARGAYKVETSTTCS